MRKKKRPRGVEGDSERDREVEEEKEKETEKDMEMEEAWVRERYSEVGAENERWRNGGRKGGGDRE